MWGIFIDNGGVVLGRCLCVCLCIFWFNSLPDSQDMVVKESKEGRNNDSHEGTSFFHVGKD